MQSGRELKKHHVGLCANVMPCDFPQKLCTAMDKGLCDWPPELENRLRQTRLKALEMCIQPKIQDPMY